MCGIAGAIAQDIRHVSTDVLAWMKASILYRGRDSQGEWSDGQNIHLLHSRLSIIDLSTGSQPMWDASGRYVIIYNGEIFNYKELRTQYERRGGQFRTRSDTEVILEGFKIKGPQVCRELNGMFAFALWDTADKILWLARDHLGKKPLFWLVAGGVFYFASTLDAFHTISGWDRTLSPNSIQFYRLYGNFPEGETIYSGARSVPHGSFASFRPGDPSPRNEPYWQLDFTKSHRQTLDDCLNEYEELLTDAIAVRLRSDVPLAITFSGGVDSGTIAAICTQKLNTSLVCYTIDYHTPDDPSEETLIAEKTARHLGLEWKYIHFDYHLELLRDLLPTYRHFDQPCTQIAMVYSQRLYEAIKPFATVVLSGNGSDELFAGYIGNEQYRKKDLLRKRFAWTRPFFKTLQNSAMSRYLAPKRLHEFLTLLEPPLPEGDPSRQASSSPDSWMEILRRKWEEEKNCHVHTMLDLAMHTGLRYGGADSNFRLPDITGLAAQVEVRSPYLDYRMVEFAARLPHSFKIGNPSSPIQNKYLPKIYYHRYVPKEIAWAEKKGMGMNLQWGKKIVNDIHYRQAFESAYRSLEQAGIASGEFRKAWEAYRQGNRRFAGVMMAGFMLYQWHARTLPAESQIQAAGNLTCRMHSKTGVCL